MQEAKATPAASRDILKKSPKSRESSPLKAIPFDVFEYQQKPVISRNAEIKAIKNRKSKSSKKGLNKTFKNKTRVISFCLSEEEHIEKENSSAPSPEKITDVQNPQPAINESKVRHCRSIAPTDFQQSIRILNGNQEISESNTPIHRRIPLRERKKSIIGLNRL